MKHVIKTANAPAAIGHYSQAISIHGFVFLSGQIPLDPVTGQVEPGGIEEQTQRVLQNLVAVLEASGSSLAEVVKTTVYLKDMSEFATMNEGYGRFFTDNPPARATAEVARLPKDVRVEIDCIASKKWTT